MSRLRHALFALRAFLRGFVGTTELGAERRGRCC